MRPIPQAPCLALIHAFEKGPNGSFAATAYQDPGGVWTIGWGHALAGPTDAVWTLAQADAQALTDLAYAAAGVSAALASVIDTLTDGQYAACIDLAFNIGVHAFATSTLARLINEGNMTLAPLQFGRWNEQNGVVLPGLVKRRAAEVDVWNATA